MEQRVLHWATSFLSLCLFLSLQQSGAAGEGEGRDAENEIRRKRKGCSKPRVTAERWPPRYIQNLSNPNENKQNTFCSSNCSAGAQHFDKVMIIHVYLRVVIQYSCNINIIITNIITSPSGKDSRFLTVIWKMQRVNMHMLCFEFVCAHCIENMHQNKSKHE